MPDADVYTEETQELVSIIENGARDENIKGRTLEKIKKILSKTKEHSFDVLILGCTHFPRLENTISRTVGCETVSSALVGALEILKTADCKGSGRNVFL